jgi:hypothetical protein
MRISCSAFNYLMKIEDLGIEQGFLLGCENGMITEISKAENYAETYDKYSFTPDIIKCNRQISAWLENDIIFSGILHTHCCNVDYLSEYDKEYIRKVFKSMPDDITTLYFPILVFPDKRIISYYSKRYYDEVIIVGDNIVIG